MARVTQGKVTLLRGFPWVGGGEARGPGHMCSVLASLTKRRELPWVHSFPC